VLILLPGLTGGSEDTYVQYAVVHAREAGIRAVVFNGRGTSDSPITTPQFYSASFTGVSVCRLPLCWPKQKACTDILTRVFASFSGHYHSVKATPEGFSGFF
jgi:predicted alpha/beta-fold hydrolase